MEFKATLDFTTAWGIMKKLILVLILAGSGMVVYLSYTFMGFFVPPLLIPSIIVCIVLFILVTRVTVEFEPEVMRVRTMIPLVGLSVRYEDMVSVGKRDGMPVFVNVQPKGAEQSKVVGPAVFVATKKKGVVYFVPNQREMVDTIVASIQSHGVPMKEYPYENSTEVEEMFSTVINKISDHEQRH